MVTIGATQPTSSPAEIDLAHVLVVARTAARRAGVPEHELDEIAQTTTIKLWQRWNRQSTRTVRADSRFRWEAYIAQTARNVRRDLIRSETRRRNRNNASANPTTSTPQPISRPGTLRPIPNDADGMTSYLGRQCILDLIVELPYRQRVAATLIIVGELSAREAADLVGVQPQAIRKQLRAAKETLIHRISQLV